MTRSGMSPNPFDEFRIDIDFKRLLPRIAPVLIGLLILIGVFTSFYTVEPEGKAVVKRFGKVVPPSREPGLHFKFPFGIDRVIFVPTERVLKEEFGFRTITPAQRSTRAKDAYGKESLMLTGDLNVIDVEWVVQYRINDPDHYLHRLRNQTETIRDISESVMRRIVGNRIGSNVLTVGRVEVSTAVQEEMQNILDKYEMGVRIITVELQDVTPPDPVKPSFDEVNKARAQEKRMINEAETRQNEVIPRAKGEAKQLIANAEGYRAQRVNRAKGEAERFKAIYAEYKQAREVTRQRFYLEAIDEVMANIGKVYIVDEGQMMPLPLLNLEGDPPGRGGGTASRGDSP